MQIIVLVKEDTIQDLVHQAVVLEGKEAMIEIETIEETETIEDHLTETTEEDNIATKDAIDL